MNKVQSLYAELIRSATWEGWKHGNNIVNDLESEPKLWLSFFMRFTDKNKTGSSKFYISDVLANINQDQSEFNTLYILTEFAYLGQLRKICYDRWTSSNEKINIVSFDSNLEISDPGNPRDKFFKVLQITWY